MASVVLQCGQLHAPRDITCNGSIATTSSGGSGGGFRNLWKLVSLHIRPVILTMLLKVEKATQLSQMTANLFKNMQVYDLYRADTTYYNSS